jgi:chromosome segregation ATPase
MLKEEVADLKLRLSQAEGTLSLERRHVAKLKERLEEAQRQCLAARMALAALARAARNVRDVSRDFEDQYGRRPEVFERLASALRNPAINAALQESE